MITIINNDEMKISVSKSFTENDDTPDKRSLSDYILEKTKEKLQFFRELFNIEKLDKIEFILFDDYDEWKKYYVSRNHREPPEYSRGSFESENRYCAYNVEMKKWKKYLESLNDISEIDNVIEKAAALKHQHLYKIACEIKQSKL